MRTLLEFYLNYLDFIYLDPRYRITDSKTGGERINASLNVTGPILSWSLVNDRGQMQVSIAPTCMSTERNWFWVSLLRQYLNGDSEIEYLPAPDEIQWMRENSDRVEQLFGDKSTAEASCEKLKDLRRSNANQYWSRWREEQGLT